MSCSSSEYAPSDEEDLCLEDEGESDEESVAMSESYLSSLDYTTDSDNKLSESNFEANASEDDDSVKSSSVSTCTSSSASKEDTVATKSTPVGAVTRSKSREGNVTSERDEDFADDESSVLSASPDIDDNTQNEEDDNFFTEDTTPYGTPPSSPLHTHHTHAEQSRIVTPDKLRSRHRNHSEKTPNAYFENYDRATSMGCQDLYVCPICLRAANSHLNAKFSTSMKSDSNDNNNQSDEETSESYSKRDDSDEGEGDDNDSDSDDSYEETEDDFVKRYPNNYEDPLYVLGSLDGFEFQIAAGFCFRLLSQCKTHLDEVHNVDPNCMEESDLYMQNKIRASGGLLQRHTNKVFSHCASHEHLLGYWGDGNNNTFVRLLNQISRFNHCKRISEKFNFDDNKGQIQLKDDDESNDIHSIESSQSIADVETAEAFLKPFHHFIRSFRQDSKRLWEISVRPFSNEIETEEEEIEEDNAMQNEGECFLQHMAFDNETKKENLAKEMEIYQAVVQGLNKKNGNRDNSDCDVDDSSDSESEAPESSDSGSEASDSSDSESEASDRDAPVSGHGEGTSLNDSGNEGLFADNTDSDEGQESDEEVITSSKRKSKVRETKSEAVKTQKKRRLRRRSASEDIKIDNESDDDDIFSGDINNDKPIHSKKNILLEDSDED